MRAEPEQSSPIVIQSFAEEIKETYEVMKLLCRHWSIML